jgi:hypothetical protein
VPASFGGFVVEVGAVVGCADGAGAGSESCVEPSQAARTRSKTAFLISIV